MFYQAAKALVRKPPTDQLLQDIALERQMINQKLYQQFSMPYTDRLKMIKNYLRDNFLSHVPQVVFLMRTTIIQLQLGNYAHLCTFFDLNITEIVATAERVWYDHAEVKLFLPNI